MQKRLNSVIGITQKTSIQSRSILHRVSIIYDTIDFHNTLNEALAVLSLPFLKDFYIME